MGQGIDDKALVRGCLEGRKGSWDAFVDRYSRLVYWSIWKTLERQNVPAKEELCREVFQDFFEKMLERPRLDRLVQADNLRNYVQAIVCHLVFDRLRHASRQARSELSIEALSLESPDLGGSPDAGEVVANEEVRSILRSVIEALPAKEKACVELCYVDGRTHREIGLLLHIPQDTVSTLLRRTKERLRRALEEKGVSG